MLPYNNKIFKNKRKHKEKIIKISLEEAIYQPQILINILESSLENQQKFIIFIKSSFDGFPKVKSINNFKQILYIIPNLIKELDLPFASLLIEENELLQLLIEIFISFNQFKPQISSIFLNLYILFDIIDEFLLSNPMEDWKDILFELDIIEENIKYEINDELNSIQTMFINLNNLYDNWIQYRNMGNNIEEDNLEYFDECLKLYMEEIMILQNDECITDAMLEYFGEMIIKIKNFRNEKFLDNYHYINNELYLEEQMNNMNLNEYNFQTPQTNNINNITNKNKKQNIQEILSNLHKIPLNKRTFFYKGEKIVEDENLLIEYKDYHFPFGDKQIYELKRQICGFINSEGGRLYIGITDQKIIKGIVLYNNNLKSLKNLLFSYIDNFSPKISDDKIKVYFIPIKNIQNDKYIDNLYIIKIIIYPGDPKILYSFSPKSFYSSIRMQGQCANLTADEIHRKIIERNKKINIINNFNQKDFDDPIPEINKNNENIYLNFEENDIMEDENQNKNLRGKFYRQNRQRNRKRNKNKNKIHKEKIVALKIFNIDENLFVKDLEIIFKDCGCFSYQFFQKRNGKSKGYGYLYFYNENLANLFIQNNSDVILGNKQIKFKEKIF